MISKTSIVILGILYNQSMSAYDILKRIDDMNMKHWFPIGNTTLYETALRLEKKTLIIGDHSNNSKVIYTISEKGKTELKNTIRALFLKIDFDTVWFCLATMYCYILDKEELKELVKQRKALLKEYYEGTSQHMRKMIEQEVPLHGICSIQRMLDVIVLEQNTLKSIEEKIIG